MGYLPEPARGTGNVVQALDLGRRSSKATNLPYAQRPSFEHAERGEKRMKYGAGKKLEEGGKRLWDA